MYLYEMRNKAWTVSDELDIDFLGVGSIANTEQELHLNVLRCSLEDTDKPQILFGCSHQMKITELAKSEYVTVTGVTISSKQGEKKEFILSVKGELEVKGLTIRKKKPFFTEEERKIRGERARENFTKRS